MGRAPFSPLMWIKSNTFLLMNLLIAFKQTRSRINAFLRQIFDDNQPSLELKKAMEYAVKNGGKRLRPFLVYQCADLLEFNHPYMDKIAAAIEIIHSYSLVHDDLPDMDNSLLRRGKPSCWQAFNPATAILVGDALQPLAFEILAEQDETVSASQQLAILHLLASASGARGMVAGQMMDMFPDKQWGEEDLRLLQSLKTGKLIEVSCLAPAILANASLEVKEKLRQLAHHLGLMYQMMDDILDETGVEMQMGKPTGQDHSKLTFVKIIGLEASRTCLMDLHRQNLSILAEWGKSDHILGLFSESIAHLRMV